MPMAPSFKKFIRLDTNRHVLAADVTSPKGPLLRE